MKNIFFYETDIGRIGIAEAEGAITNLYFGEIRLPKDFTSVETEVLREASRQLDSYLRGDLREFELNLAPEGTGFMQSVWKALREIPYGETRSYREIAVSLGNPMASRAVGLANNRNPIPIFIPCHRVLGSNGKLTGYLGGLDVKEKLLRLEK